MEHGLKKFQMLTGMKRIAVELRMCSGNNGTFGRKEMDFVDIEFFSQFSALGSIQIAFSYLLHVIGKLLGYPDTIFFKLCFFNL